MKYAAIRNRIQSGDLIALTHTKWGSLYDLQVQVVRTVQQSEYSHIGIAYVMGGRVWLIESVDPLIRMVPLSNLADEGFYLIPTESPISYAELIFALSEIGVGRYSKWEAIKAFFHKIAIGKNAVWECAEFVIACRKLSGVNLGNVATPSAVVQVAQEAGAPLYFIKG